VFFKGKTERQGTNGGLKALKKERVSLGISGGATSRIIIPDQKR